VNSNWINHLAFTKDLGINCLALGVSFLFVERSRKPIVAVLFAIGWGTYLFVRGFLVWP
jgi:EamA domain-containing membrane protein RarD